MAPGGRRANRALAGVAGADVCCVVLGHLHQPYLTPKGAPAAFGGAFTIVAAFGLTVNERLKKKGRADQKIGEANRRIDTMERSLFQFDLLEVNRTIFTALAIGKELNPKFQADFIKLMLADRERPFKLLLLEAHYTSAKDFREAATAYDKLLAGARAGDRTSFDGMKIFEFEKASFVRELRDGFINIRFDLQRSKKQLDERLDTFQAIGFICQQAGFLAILIAGLFLQNEGEKRPPAA
jgi:hypothetical protein